MKVSKNRKSRKRGAALRELADLATAGLAKQRNRLAAQTEEASCGGSTCAVTREGNPGFQPRQQGPDFIGMFFRVDIRSEPCHRACMSHIYQ